MGNILRAYKLDSVARNLIRLLTDHSLCLAAAESCTAGLVASTLACISGVSSCFWGSYVCYTRRAKIKMLGIGDNLLTEYGMVSGETARAMAWGALQKSGANAAVSVTGLAGPQGDGSSVPVGTIWIGTAICLNNEREIKTEASKFFFAGSRNKIREQAALAALKQITIKLAIEIEEESNKSCPMLEKNH